MNRIERLEPSGTNSTHFTMCCGCAIVASERCCPSCGEEVVGADIENHHERGVFRWMEATKHWKTKHWKRG